MEFQNNNGTAAKDAAAGEINNTAPNGAKTNGTSAKTANGKADTKETAPGSEKPAPAAPNAEEHKNLPAGQAGGEPKPGAGQPKEEAKSARQELTLEAKIRTVNDLHRKTIQRLALLARIKTLEEFEVKLIEENDELETNPYQGCKLIIEDDKRRQFTTNTPGLIRMVAQFIFDACEAKLSEIEATINFPQA